jgi:hypothetical protein
MKFKTETLKLTELFGLTTNDGSDAWLSVPVGTTEGFISDLQQFRGKYPDDHPDEKLRGQEKDPGGRRGNIMLLDRVVEWNLDDDKGSPVPLTRTITIDTPAVKARAKREAISLDDAVFAEKSEIVRMLPIELYLELAQRMLNTKALSERAEAFLKTSSELSS